MRRMKKCLGCKELKNISEFYNQTKKNRDKTKSWEYLDTRCMACRTVEHSQRRRNIKLQAINYLGGICKDCGYKEDYPEVYDFHHLDPLTKDRNVFASVKAFERIKSELDKCILLCANCHRKRHSRWNIKTDNP